MPRRKEPKLTPEEKRIVRLLLEAVKRAEIKEFESTQDKSEEEKGYYLTVDTILFGNEKARINSILIKLEQ